MAQALKKRQKRNNVKNSQRVAAWRGDITNEPCAVCAANGKDTRAIHAHHIIREQLLEREAVTRGYDFAEVQYDWKNRLPLCKEHHDNHHSGKQRISLPFLQQHKPEVIAFAIKLGLLWALEKEYAPRETQFCKRCGKPLEGKNYIKANDRRLYCDKECYKSAHQGVCSKCGGPTSDVRTTQCLKCKHAGGSQLSLPQPQGQVTVGRRAFYRANRTLIERMWAQGYTERFICETIGMPYKQGAAAEWRSIGWNIPYKLKGKALENVQAASRNNIAKGTEASVRARLRRQADEADTANSNGDKSVPTPAAAQPNNGG